MSSSIWTRCGAKRNRADYSAEPYRVVEAQHQNATRRLVDSDEEQEILETMIDAAKPRVPSAVAALGLHWLLSTPFRYPPLVRGSRFGRSTELGIWYGSEDEQAAFAEKAYQQFLFRAGTRADLDRIHLQLSLFSASVESSEVVDITRAAFAAHAPILTSKVSYVASQALGSSAREAGIEIIRFPSARCAPARINVAVLSARAFSRPVPTTPSTWDCFVNDDLLEVRKTNSFEKRIYEFKRGAFEVDGVLPSPAV
jgi:hypothetical protein